MLANLIVAIFLEQCAVLSLKKITSLIPGAFELFYLKEFLAAKNQEV
jgi:hypothetical protein